MLGREVAGAARVKAVGLGNESCRGTEIVGIGALGILMGNGDSHVLGGLAMR